jgi:hypothetical protein
MVAPTTGSGTFTAGGGESGGTVGAAATTAVAPDTADVKPPMLVALTTARSV